MRPEPASLIACHVGHLAARCRQRGYTLNEVAACIVRQDGEQLVVDTEHPAYPRKREEWKPIMVGDLVEKALTAVGITQERVERLTRTAGKPGGCGCQGRKRWLNEKGVEVQKAIRAAAKKVYGI